MEEDTKENKWAPLVNISSCIKNLVSCGVAYGFQGWDNYTNHWNLDQPETNKQKENKYKMSDE